MKLIDNEMFNDTEVDTVESNVLTYDTDEMYIDDILENIRIYNPELYGKFCKKFNDVTGTNEVNTESFVKFIIHICK